MPRSGRCNRYTASTSESMAHCLVGESFIFKKFYSPRGSKPFPMLDCLLPWEEERLQGNEISPRKPSPGVKETAQGKARQAEQGQWPHLALSPGTGLGQLLPKDTKGKSPPG